MDWLKISEKVAIVTGGSSGIGKAIVEELLNDGVKVANFDLTPLDFSNDKLLSLKVDITNRQQVEEAVDKVVSKFGKVDALVNNAGINVPSLLVDGKSPQSMYEISDNLFDKITTINQKGLFIMSQIVGRIFVENKSGVIINMSSEAGLEGSEGQSVYAATKAAVYSYTRSWSKELGKHGVRVVGIAPGIMEATGLRTQSYEEALAYTRGKTVDDIRSGYSSTSTTPLGRSGKLSEVADLVAYYISDRSSYITGVTTNVAGGKTRG
ncbi:SDR family oxidoreductase [Streptococcus parauberis]|uniref:SDR family oxidoreductase n=1 Tax=Streptococcus parauberis TaxID=1348 RepID=UPI0002E9071F|nr:SDR family oxidoreductase [Streptococcus parauberis]UWM90816.1 SDR family oxidoreductase [Streptococcus parauberis]WEM62969.1 SDR family oxidoreductase [Streptococcus parauberis]GAJ61323.1 sorbitol-6-phosphate 2-dehydrogenase [Streptococcus parauberis]